MAESRFEDVPQQVTDMVESVREKWFPELDGARIKVVFDTKKRSTGGKITLGRMMRANDLTRFLTIEEAETTEGYDYFMFLDKVVYDAIEDGDRVRLIRHELRHTHVDIENESNPWKIQGHEIEDFYDEIDMNREDPRWMERVATMAEALYDPENQGEE